MTDDDAVEPEAALGGPTMSQPAAGPRATGVPVGTFEAFQRIQPFLAVVIMVTTFMLLPQPFAVALIGLVWLLTTRMTRSRLFLGLTLTQALAWAATLVIAILCLALIVYSLGGGTQ